MADTEVRSDLPTVKFGTAKVMGLDSSPVRIALMRFNVSVPAGEVVTKATLRLFMTSTSSSDVFVKRVASTTWGETTTSYSNAPAIGSQVAASGPFTANSYLSINVTPMISGSGLVSMAVTRTSTVPLGFSSREAAAGTQPQFVVETAAIPVADTEVRSDMPTVNFGTAKVMGLGNSPVRVALMRFNVSVPAGEVVTKATLRLLMTSTSSSDVFVKQVASTTWGETTTSYSNAPAIGSQVAASGPFTANSYLSINVTPAVTGSGLVSMAVTRTSTVPLGFSSREAAAGTQPQLVVETASGSPVGIGSLPVGSARYPVPSGAVFVSKSGSDWASGTLAAPLRTIQRAINIAPSGRTIVVRAGIYHESINIPSNRTFTIQAYPGEAVWLDGSSTVTGWVRSGSVWVKSGWTAAFNSTPGFTAELELQFHQPQLSDGLASRPGLDRQYEPPAGEFGQSGGRGDVLR